jgi:outer membrane biosynthesis protein TonB
VTNANELKLHLQEWLRKPTEDLATHLREAHGLTGELPKLKTKLAQLHGQQDHEDAPATDAASQKDADVLRGVTRPKEETAKAATKAPARKAPAKPATKPAPAKTTTRKAPAAKAAPKPAPAKPATRKAAAKPASPKPATKAPAKAASNGSAPVASVRETNQTVARKLATLAAEAFGSESDEVKAKVAYWLHSLPTGGEGGSWNRWWPESLPRPETADWRAPA